MEHKVKAKANSYQYVYVFDLLLCHLNANLYWSVQTDTINLLAEQSSLKMPFYIMGQWVKMQDHFVLCIQYI